MRGIAIAGVLALGVSGAGTRPAQRAIVEPFDRPPVEARSGDLHFRHFVFWRDRNPNGQVVIHRSLEGRQGVARLVVVPPRSRAGRLALAERAELREATDDQLIYGTPVRYSFSMRLGPAARSATRRLVVAQLKSPATHMANPSPFFALRVMRGRLVATVEFEETPGDGSELIARSPGLPCPEGWRPAQRHWAGQVRVFLNDVPPPQARHCTKAVAFAILAPMPDAIGRWTDIAVAIRPGPDGQGSLDLVVDGVRIAEARGRIGHRMEPGRQFFKIGPYRDAAEGELAVELDDLRRTILPREAI